MPKCKICKQNMIFYVYVYKGMGFSFYFCPNLLEGFFKSFETEIIGSGSKYVYCRHLEVDSDKQRLDLKQSEVRNKCWYCGERLWVFAKPSGKIDVMYICPTMVGFMTTFYEHEQKKFEWRIYCKPSPRAHELISKKQRP